ncbi:uncharacterized protein LOC108622826 [Ceratina calcarata]|uniref:Uncharacterized protein LOC108622826 n=1 Tax=Ceratina calcarata TaxID=156304 RepID=A0AAJ7N3X2_9HYME|nr:uncharacterized protein LOC108622826 [Ceratina calcarata]
MFRDGQYLEVIKASDNCLATAVVTVQEKTIRIKEKTVSTNKWLGLEDWAALYKILEKAILRNKGSPWDHKKHKWKKSTRQLDITYTFEQPESTRNVPALPTIRVNVSPAKRKVDKANEKDSTRQRDNKDEPVSKKSENDNLSRKAQKNAKNDRIKRYLPIDSIENGTLEEYVPDGPVTKKLCANLNYIPSRKSTLEQIQVSLNEYTPSVSDNKSVAEVARYVPNSVDSSKVSYEVYEPSGTPAVSHLDEYVPNSKGVKASVEEYHPDFTSKSMKFDDSYVPSSVQLTNENSKRQKTVHSERPRLSQRH